MKCLIIISVYKQRVLITLNNRSSLFNLLSKKRAKIINSINNEENNGENEDQQTQTDEKDMVLEKENIFFLIVERIFILVLFQVTRFGHNRRVDANGIGNNQLMFDKQLASQF